MVSEILAWWMTPLSGAQDHLLPAALAWHGRLMVLAWGVAVPVSVLLARYFKVMPGQDFPRVLDHRFWWQGHRALGYLALALTAAGLALVAGREGHTGLARDVHGWMGWCIAVVALLQLAGAHLRGSKGGPTDPRCADDGRILDLRGDHYDMTARRILFERIHKFLGVAALAMAWVTLMLGLHVTDAPRWMWLMLAVWWTGLLAWAWRLQSRGRCVDTYQAIWGLDPALPGARRPPIGWGIRRFTLKDLDREGH